MKWAKVCKETDSAGEDCWCVYIKFFGDGDWSFYGRFTTLWKAKEVAEKLEAGT